MTNRMDQVIDWIGEINDRGAILHGVSFMAENDFNFEDDGRYYTELAAAFVRGKIGGRGDLSPEELIGLGRARGLRLHKFKCQRTGRVSLAAARFVSAYGSDRAGSQSDARGGY